MTTATEALRNTAFGRVLCEIVAARGIEPTPARVGKLAEEAGLDGWKVINRMASADAEPPGSLAPLADALELGEEERDWLSRAYALEQD